jgi:hypothetical protein
MAFKKATKTPFYSLSMRMGNTEMEAHTPTSLVEIRHKHNLLKKHTSIRILYGKQCIMEIPLSSNDPLWKTMYNEN